MEFLVHKMGLSWTYSSHFLPPVPYKDFASIRAALFCPQEMHVCAGWPSLGALAPFSPAKLGLWIGDKVCCHRLSDRALLVGKMVTAASVLWF